MFRGIVVGYDDSDHAKDALGLGRQLSASTGADLTLAHVSVLGLSSRLGQETDAMAVG